MYPTVGGLIDTLLRHANGFHGALEGKGSTLASLLLALASFGALKDLLSMTGLGLGQQGFRASGTTYNAHGTQTERGLGTLSAQNVL